MPSEQKQKKEMGIAGIWICQQSSRITYGRGKLVFAPCSDNIKIANVDAEGVALSIELIPYNSFELSIKGLRPDCSPHFSLGENECIVIKDTMPWEKICYNKEEDTVTKFFSTGNTDITTVYTRHK